MNKVFVFRANKPTFPSDSWYYDFLHRNDLDTFRSLQLDENRYDKNDEGVINAFFTHTYKPLNVEKNFKKSLIFNVDETWLNFKNYHLVVEHKSAHHVYEKEIRNLYYLTLQLKPKNILH